MTFDNLLTGLGVVVLAGVLFKGFWGVTLVKPLEQPDNPQSDGASPM